MTYKEFLITAEPFIPDLLSGFLWELNITGLSEEVNCIKIFSHDLTKDNIEVLLQNLVDNKLLSTFNVEENFVEERNWNEEWEKSRNIIKVSDKIVIKPTFKDYNAQNNEIVIAIDPKMSFGTGEHHTTRMMIQLIEKYIKPGIKVLDIGTGTGILAIAAIKLGAAKAVAFDIDDYCFENTLENCQLNSVSDKISIRRCSLNEIKDNDFDMVLANIQKNILLEMISGIFNRINEEGILILSGILYIDEEEINNAYSQSGFILSYKLQTNEWLALVFIKKRNDSLIN